MFGIEAEYLLLNCWIRDVLRMQLPGITAEFYRFMVEVITDPHEDAADAAMQLQRRVERLQQRGVLLQHHASFDRNIRKVSFNDVTKDDPYYRWVYHWAAQRGKYKPLDLHHVGIHLNYSDSNLSEDQMIHAVNWLRCMNFLFILFSANSPVKSGLHYQLLSRRAVQYPNRYDVPLWRSAGEFKSWIQAEEEVCRIYPGKGRCWMPACPRLADNDHQRELTRIELRSIDSGIGMPWALIHSCFQLMERIVLQATSNILPAAENELQLNDLAVGRQGANAKVRLNGQSFSAREVATLWCKEIPDLEQILEDGPPAVWPKPRTNKFSRNTG